MVHPTRIGGVRRAVRSLVAPLLGMTVCIGLVVDASSADKHKTKTQWMLRPAQTADLAPLPEVAARQKCGNWAWAAAVEGVLRTAGLAISQNELVMKASGGELCGDESPSPQEMIHAIEGELRLEDGRKFRLQTRYRPGAPTSPEDLIVSVMRRHPLVLFWRGRAYLLAGVTYDEYIAPTGARRFEIRALRLADPLAPPEKKAAERLVTFVKGRDDPGEIEGVLEVVAAPVP